MAALPVVSPAGLHGRGVRMPPCPNACWCLLPTRRCGGAPVSVEPRPHVEGPGVSGAIMWVSSLGPQGDGGRRLVYSSESWVQTASGGQKAGVCSCLQTVSSKSVFTIRKEAQTSWGGAAGPHGLWGAAQGVDLPEGPSHMAVLKQCPHSPPVLLRAWSPRLSRWRAHPRPGKRLRPGRGGCGLRRKWGSGEAD